MTRAAPALASHAAARGAHPAAPRCRVIEHRRRSAPPHACFLRRRSTPSVAWPAAFADRHVACTGSLEDIPDSEPMDGSTSPADVAVSVRDSSLAQRKKFRVRIRITPAQQVGLDEFWKAQARGVAHARRELPHSPRTRRV